MAFGKGAKFIGTSILGVFPAAFAGLKDEMLGLAIEKKLKSVGPEANLLLASALYTSAHHVLIPWMKAVVKANRSVFRGQLHQRINAKARVKTKYKTELDFGALGVRYAYNVEKGAPPHEANINKIRQYVTKKMGFKGEDATEIAIAIWETIRTEGSKPHPFVMPVWKAGHKRFRRDVLKRMDAALTAAMKK